MTGPIRKEIHVIGAGFSGMSLALELIKHGFRVHVYDSQGRTGGMIESLPFHGAIVESAAHSMTRTEKPAFARKMAEVSPMMPPPRMRTSGCFAIRLL